ncbi:hypothetical protein POTOM_026069 [Populus tomentosa]|uniref:Transmembrane protein n=1 Tax=Populus tomentosa TaxID=118781 RepID=A0A8X7ZQ81_POPTO|nr:hypothetical protein POTOM_026069 [Populus tomentosa]
MTQQTIYLKAQFYRSLPFQFFLFFLGKQKRERKGYTYLKDKFMREETMAIDRASSFPGADVDQALNPSQNKEFEVDPVSSDIATSKETGQEQDAAARKREREKQDAMHKLKTTILVSAVIIAVAGAVFAVTKKLRER